MHRIALKTLAGLLCAAVAMPLLPPAAWGSFMLPPTGYRAKDFSLIRHQGLYHLFYTRRNVNAHPDSTENDFGHAVSTDLIAWQQFAAKLPVRPGHWDNRHVWAPHIVESEGIHYMFYTGVTQTPGQHQYHQRIGVATSTDLITWSRQDEPLFSCASVPWVYCNPMDALTSFRDPFVMRGPYGDGWRMFYSTRPTGDSAHMVVGAAGTGGLEGPWGDLGPLWVTHRDVTTSYLAESPHLFDREGLWFMLWTSSQQQPLLWATSPDPVGPLSAWTYRGTLSSMLGYDTSPWFASEHLRVGLLDYFAAASATAIEIMRMDWTSPTRFVLVQPSTFHVRGMWWSKDVVAEGDTAAITVHATGFFGNSAEIEVLAVDADGGETLVPNAEVGLPNAIPLTSNQTVHVWTAKRWPDGGGAEPGPALVIRTTDRTAVAGPIRVEPLPPPAPSAGGAQLEDDPGFAFRLVTLRWSPLGAAFRLDLPDAAEARLDLYDVVGRRLATLHRGRLSAGVHVVRLGHAAKGWAPGVYFAALETPYGRRTARFAVTP